MNNNDRALYDSSPVAPRTMVKAYLSGIMSGISARAGSQSGAAVSADALAAEVFSILTNRKFCYLGRTKTAPYHEQVAGVIEDAIRANEPLRFYYDLGAGYHATIHPGETGLMFHVGLSELLVLFQINAFCDRVAELYSPGAVFHLVIDNICGLMTNDIPIEDTKRYCESLRRLVSETSMNDRVDLLVESEEFPLSGYDLEAVDAVEPFDSPSQRDVENVERFLGRHCDVAEAAKRMARYVKASEMTEEHLAGIVRGVRMTQRATGGTLGFRPFPGGDSRTQCGEVALGPNSKGKLRPFLLTSRNVENLDCTRWEYPGLLPPVLSRITYAAPRRI